MTTTTVTTTTERSVGSRLRWADVPGLAALGLRIRRTRTVLTATGIAIGIAAMVAVLGISASSRADLLASLDALGTDLLEVTPGQSVFGEASTLPPEATAMIARVGPVTSAAATTTVDAAVRRTDLISEQETGGIAVLAARPELVTTLELELTHGRFLDDATDGLPAVVLGATAAERLGIDDLAGQPVVRVGDEWFAVVGILAPTPLTPSIDRAAVIGEEVAGERFGTELTPGTVYVRARPDQVEEVAAVLPRTANPAHPEEVQVARPSDALEARAATDTALTALLLGLGGVALLVGGVGIANVMVISVLERRSEIGLRRALGATAGHIRLQFLTESVLLSGLGGIAGVTLGALITAGYADRQGWTLDVPTVALVAGVGAAVTIGALAGLYPASRAARLDPAEALHPA